LWYRSPWKTPSQTITHGQEGLCEVQISSEEIPPYLVGEKKNKKQKTEKKKNTTTYKSGHFGESKRNSLTLPMLPLLKAIGLRAKRDLLSL